MKPTSLVIVILITIILIMSYFIIIHIDQDKLIKNCDNLKKIISKSNLTTNKTKSTTNITKPINSTKSNTKKINTTKIITNSTKLNITKVNTTLSVKSSIMSGIIFGTNDVERYKIFRSQLFDTNKTNDLRAIHYMNEIVDEYGLTTKEFEIKYNVSITNGT